jgi:chromosome partitioning protein
MNAYAFVRSVRIPKSRLVAALCRVVGEDEEAAARAYVEAAGHEVLGGSIPESSTYHVAHNRGRSIIETDEQALNDRAHALIEVMLTKVAAVEAAPGQRRTQ